MTLKLVPDEQAATPDTDAALVVFGLDEGGKAHASRFNAADAELAEKAAGLMGMKVLHVTTPEHAAAASGLPSGRIFATGRGFVPFCKMTVYERLSAFAEAYAPSPPVELADAPMPAVTGVPTSWTDLGPGGLVLATTGPQEGWYEVVVVEAKPEDLFELRWRDWPEEPSIVRARDQLALLPAVAAEQ